MVVKIVYTLLALCDHQDVFFFCSLVSSLLLERLTKYLFFTNCSFNSHTHSLSPSLSRNCSFCFILFPRIALDFDFANNLDKPVTAV
eukprot:m.347451 g.347451  ORF g.347451 m.347451 type:complete len:87 (+) comp16144_c0_seq35:6622-6882(+)